MIPSTSNGSTYKREDFNIIQHARKSLLYHKAKEKHHFFDKAIRAYNRVKFVKLWGFFLLNNLANEFDKNSVDLYREYGLALFTNINGHRVDKIRTKFHQIF